MAQILTYAQAVGRTIIEEMRRDPNIFTFGWYLGTSALASYPYKDLIQEFGYDRICNTGICETQVAGAAIGAALTGGRPIADTWLTGAALDGWGQIVDQAANIRFKLGGKADCPAVFQLAYGARPGGSVHHSTCLHNWIANSPGLYCVLPSTPADGVGLWRTALRFAKDPVVMMEHYRLMAAVKGSVPDDDYTIPFGKADIKRIGKDVTIAAAGYMVNLCLDAAIDLAKQGIDAEVWDARTLTPFDRESLLASVKKTRAMVVVDNAPKSFGTTGEFFATVGEAMDPIPPMARVAALDATIAFSPPLENYIFPSKDKIISAVKNVLDRKNRTIGSR